VEIANTAKKENYQSPMPDYKKTNIAVWLFANVLATGAILFLSFLHYNLSPALGPELTNLVRARAAQHLVLIESLQTSFVVLIAAIALFLVNFSLFNVLRRKAVFVCIIEGVIMIGAIVFLSIDYYNRIK
jgi:hypothetical protein